jgi:hypothetical protein
VKNELRKTNTEGQRLEYRVLSQKKLELKGTFGKLN